MAIALALVGVAYALWWRDRAPRGSATEPAVVAATRDAAGRAPAPGAPVRLLVLGVSNQTTDPQLDGTVDALLNYALRRSRAIDPQAGVQLRRLAAELDHPDAPDERLGAKLAARDHAQILVLRGTVSARGVGFVVAIDVRDATTGTLVFEGRREATTAHDVVGATAHLATEVRTALGETLTEEERMQPGLSQSLDADHEFAQGTSLSESGDWGAAASHFERALTLDPTFAIAHARLAIMYTNLKRSGDARAHLQLALASVDRMGERDRYKFLGDYFLFSTEDYERAISAYQQLLASWPDDVAARINLSIAYDSTNQLEKSLALTAETARANPRFAVVRGNEVSATVMAGQFDRAIELSRTLFSEFARPTRAMREYYIEALFMTGRRDEAIAGLAQLAAVDASRANGLEANLAIAEGRLREAIAILERGITQDLADNDDDSAESKRAMLAEVHARRRDRAATRTAAALVKESPLRLRDVALALLAVGDERPARAIAARFAKSYRAFLAMTHQADDDDPLVLDARRRLAGPPGEPGSAGRAP